MEQTINFKQILMAILKRIYIVIIFTVIGFLVGYFYNNSKEIITYYDVNASLYLKPEIVESDDNFEQITTIEKMSLTYAELLKSKIVIDKVIENLNLDSYYTDIRNNLTVTVIPGTSVINIIHTGNDKDKAMKFVKELCKTFTEDEAELGVDGLQIINDGNVTNRTISQKNNRYIVSATAFGLILGIVSAYGMELYFPKKSKKKSN